MSDKATELEQQTDPDEVTCRCAHCGTDLTARMQFCPACGTSRTDRPNAVFELAREMTSYETRIWRTVRALLFRPGLPTAEWVAERRAAYTSPAKLFVVVTTVAFLVLSAIGSVTTSRAPTAEPAAPLAGGAERPQWEVGFGTGGIVLRNLEYYAADIESMGVDGFLESRGIESGSLQHFAISRAIRKYQNNGWADASSNHQRNMSLLIYLLLPAFPLLLMLVTPRRPYEQHFVFCIHVVSFFFVVACVAAFLGIWLGEVMTGVAILATLVYLVIALRRVYGFGWLRSVPSGLFIGSVALFLCLGFAFISALLVVSL